MSTGTYLRLIFRIILLSLCVGTSFEFHTGRRDANIKCIERERHALLMIKQSLVDEQGRLSSWGTEDCCKWKGVRCSNQTRHVVMLSIQLASMLDSPFGPSTGNISSSLLELQQLTYLDLSFNNFRGQNIPEFIGSLKHLRYLNLSYAGFEGRVPYQLGNLSNLQYLDLSYNFGLYANKLGWLSHLSFLRNIYLNNVNLSDAIDGLQVLGNLPSLAKLELSGCSLQSVISPSVSFINSSRSLTSLDLSQNNISNLVYLWLVKISSSLVDLDLSGNKLQGPIPNYVFQNMSSLVHLDLSKNQIDGIPKSFGNFCRMKTLNLENNNLTGQLPELFLNLSGCTRNTLEILSLYSNTLTGSFPDFTSFSSLRELYLYDNRLDGSFPESFGQSSNLAILYLNANQLRGSLPDFSVFRSMKDLDVSSNKLSGAFPKGIGQLSKLEFLNLSSNSLEGMITQAYMSNLSSLNLIDLSFNSLSLNFSSDWVPPFQLDYIKLAGCELGPSFPKWLQTQNKFEVLDLSDAGISGTVPNWLWGQSPILNSLNLSHNHISGMLPDLSTKFSGYPGIDLSSNLFEGPIPPVPPNVSSLLLSRNMFSGSISFVCKTIGEYFSYLDLSDNQLSGQLPNCTTHWQKLTILNLANNNISGKIPNSLDSRCTLQSLHLQKNNFAGELPSSLKNCTGLTVLELGNNRFSGRIPAWFGYSLTDLTVLSLRSNQFLGSLPIQLCNLPKLQVLDLSQNNVSGTIPKCFNNFTAMSQEESSNLIITYLFPFSLTIGMGGDVANYEDELSLIWKGIDSMYKNTLGLVKSIDLSSNKLSGELPVEIMSLKGLISLNISTNYLTGPIPPQIGQLSLLNSLDLSKNLLTGIIPESFSQLNSLGVLNLSKNKLSGKIPSNAELQRFDASAYIGNPGLCGSPLPNKCPGEESVQVPALILHADKEDGFMTRDIFFSMALGFIVGFWAVCGSLLLNRTWRYAYFSFLSDLKDWFYILITVNMAKLQRVALAGVILLSIGNHAHV